MLPIPPGPSWAGSFFVQRGGQSREVLAGGGDGDIEVLRQALAPVGLNRDAADCHVLDIVPGERSEELACIEPARVVASQRSTPSISGSAAAIES